MDTQDLTLIDVVVTARHDPAPGIAVLDLARPDGAPLPAFAAGAHIDVHVADGLVRQYSLCNPPGEVGRYRIGVLDDPRSRGGSRAIHAGFTPGYRTRISAPRNLFPLAMGAPASVLVGGGIGITPMVAMAHALAAAGRPFSVHYCVRTRAAAAFADELAAAFGDRVALHLDDGPPDQRLDPAAVVRAAGPGAHLYVCGPEGFMDWVMAEARAGGLPEDALHFEYFAAHIDTHGAAFEVVAAKSGVTVRVGEDETILDALAAAGVKVPKSCAQGVCGTCICDVIEGDPDHKDKFLTAAERAAGDQIAVCCSRARSPRLVLDI